MRIGQKIIGTIIGKTANGGVRISGRIVKPRIAKVAEQSALRKMLNAGGKVLCNAGEQAATTVVSTLVANYVINKILSDNQKEVEEENK